MDPSVWWREVHYFESTGETVALWTEPVLLLVTNRTLWAVHTGQGAYLVMLDLPSAFYTIHHVTFNFSGPRYYTLWGLQHASCHTIQKQWSWDWAKIKKEECCNYSGNLFTNSCFLQGNPFIIRLTIISRGSSLYSPHKSLLWLPTCPWGILPVYTGHDWHETAVISTTTIPHTRDF